MTSPVIRDATPADLPALADIFRRASWSNVDDRPLLTAHPEFLDLSPVAVDEGRTRMALVGGAVAGFVSIVGGHGHVELEDLFVDPEQMRRGVGRALIADIVERARTAGVPRVEVDGNEHARDFYESVGFVAGERVLLEHGVATRMTLVVDEVTPPRR